MTNLKNKNGIFQIPLLVILSKSRQQPKAWFDIITVSFTRMAEVVGSAVYVCRK